MAKIKDEKLKMKLSEAAKASFQALVNNAEDYSPTVIDCYEMFNNGVEWQKSNYTKQLNSLKKELKIE